MADASLDLIEPGPLHLDAHAATEAITAFLVEALSRRLRRRGLVLGVSGGIDSAACAALAARAVGPDRVLALLMPERDTPADATARAAALCAGLGVQAVVEDIGPALEALGCYRWRDAAIRRLFPPYGAGWRQKIVLAGADGGFNRFDMVVEDPSGNQDRKRMPADIYLEVVAATNMKQRTRKLIEYAHAERLNYAVLGTPNRLEYALGFFVRGGDGLADVKPIAHLYKTQVYALADYLGIPEAIRRQRPSTDTYSLAQSQEEFYFTLPYERMDLVLHAYDQGLPPEAAARALGLPPERVSRLFRDIEGKMTVARHGLQEALTLKVPAQGVPAQGVPAQGART